jgi:hypothetical protein
MGILNRILGTAQTAGRSRATGRTAARRPVRSGGTTRGAGFGRGVGMAKRPAPRRTAYGRTPSTAAGGLSGLIGGLLRRR